MTEHELNRVRDLRTRMRDLERHLQALRLSAANIVPIIDGLPHSTDIRRRVEMNVVKIVDTERELDQLREEYVNAAIDLEGQINSAPLDLQEKTILILRYVACKNFRDIEFELKSNDARVFYLHRTAQKKFLKLKSFQVD